MSEHPFEPGGPSSVRVWDADEGDWKDVCNCLEHPMAELYAECSCTESLCAVCVRCDFHCIQAQELEAGE